MVEDRSGGPQIGKVLGGDGRSMECENQIYGAGI